MCLYWSHVLSSQISVSCKRESIIKAVISSILSIMYSRMPTAQRGFNKYLSKLHFSLTSSTLHLPGLSLSWVVFIVIPSFQMLASLLFFWATIAFLCSEIFGCYYKSLNKQAHRKSCHLSGRGLTPAVPLGRESSQRNQQGNTQNIYLEYPFFCPFKFLSKQQSKRKNIQVLQFESGLLSQQVHL